MCDLFLFRESQCGGEVGQLTEPQAQLRCNNPKHRYFCANETQGPNFPPFLIPLVKMLLLQS
jgi:hypothetical protein